MNKLTIEQRDYLVKKIANLKMPTDAGNKSFQEGLYVAKAAMTMAVAEILNQCTEEEDAKTAK